jgi:hypothetical protein
MDINCSVNITKTYGIDMTKTIDAALKLALEYIETNAHERRHVRWAIKEALAQPVQEPTCPECKAAVLYECVACSSNNYPPAAQPEQEPVGQVGEDKHGLVGDIYDDRKVKIGDKLYTSLPQRQWVGLTDDDLLQIRETVQVVEGRSVLQSLTKAIEQALKEKNT